MIMKSTPEAILKSLGICLDTIKVPPPKALYSPAVRSGNLVYLAGHVPYDELCALIIGKACVGEVHSTEAAKEFSRRITVNLLKSLKSAIGELSLVERIVKVTGFINCAPTFTEHSMVINGASELLVQVFGEQRGMHARTAVGAPSLPFDVPVEIEMIVQVSQ